jgi:hypothetical protein
MILIAKDEQELQAFKDKTVKLRAIALDEIGVHPMEMSKLNRRQRDKILKRIEEMWDEPDCTPLFNEIISKTLFDSPDMSVLPCGQTSYAPPEDKEHIPWK